MQPLSKVFLLNPEKLPDDFASSGFFALDVETTGLHFDDTLFIASLADEKYDILLNYKNYADMPWPSQAKSIGFYLSGLQYKYVFIANAVFDMQKVKNDCGISLNNPWCVLSVERMLNSNMPNIALSDVAKNYSLLKNNAVEEIIKLAKLYEEKNHYGVLEKKPLYAHVPFDIMRTYAVQDARITYEIGLAQYQKVSSARLDVSERVFREVELTSHLYRCHMHGILVDKQLAETNLLYHQKKYIETKQILTNILGEFKVNPTKKQFEYLFKKHNTPMQFTKKLQMKTSDDVFPQDVEDFELIRKMRLHYKLWRTFYYNILTNLSEKDDHHTLHPNLLQFGTVTGRLSSENPNLQNLGSKDHVKEVKSIFIARRKTIFVEADFKSMELHVAYFLSGESELLNLILKGEDPHQKTADLLQLSRNNAKTFIFSFLYGASQKKLSLQTGLSFQKIYEITNTLKKKLPKLYQYKQKLIKQVEILGFVITPMGRVLKLKKQDSYKVLNAVIQSTCADVVKDKMKHLSAYLRLQVHDSFLYEIYEKQQILLIKKHLEDNPFGLKVSIKTGINYAELTPVDI
jgi:DNA polymerase I-like protein with 3'-5' exonuclease and polymerase domains